MRERDGREGKRKNVACWGQSMALEVGGLGCSLVPNEGPVDWGRQRRDWDAASDSCSLLSTSCLSRRSRSWMDYVKIMESFKSKTGEGSSIIITSVCQFLSHSLSPILPSHLLVCVLYMHKHVHMPTFSKRGLKSAHARPHINRRSQTPNQPTSHRPTHRPAVLIWLSNL